MLKILRLFISDIRNKSTRFTLIESMVKNIPGKHGIEIRRRVYGRYLGAMGSDVRIGTDVRIRHIEKLRLGSHVYIGAGSFIQAGGGIEIADNVMLGPGVKIWSVNHRFDNAEAFIFNQGYDYKPVIIETGAWCGANAFIMPGAHIGQGAIISACAVVGDKAIPPYRIVAGNPGRVIGARNSGESSVTPEQN